MSNAELCYMGDFLKLHNFKYHQADIYYNTSFDLEIRSGAFCGIAPCEYYMPEFRKFVMQLSDLYEFKRTQVKFEDIGYGSNMEFKIDRAGHISISGTIFGDAQLQSLEFAFTADQTALKPFLADLRLLIDTNLATSPSKDSSSASASSE